MTPSQADSLYTQALNSGIDAVVEVAMTAMQNAVDQVGKIGDELTEMHTEVFVSTLKMDLDSNAISETVLRWFATRELRMHRSGMAE